MGGGRAQTLSAVEEICAPWDITYNPRVSLVTDAGVGYDVAYAIMGIDSTGTIHQIGGLSSVYSDRNYRWPYAQFLNVYDSYLSYDTDSNDQGLIDVAQMEAQFWDWEFWGTWPTSRATKPQFMPAFTHPLDTSRIALEYAYCPHLCSTQIGDTLYAVNLAGDAGQHTHRMGVYHMLNRTWDDQDAYASLLPGMLQGFIGDSLKQIQEQGCTTNNGTHIFYITTLLTREVITQLHQNHTSVMYAYDVANDVWIGNETLNQPLLDDRLTASCASSVDGRYIYMFGGSRDVNPITGCNDRPDSFEMDVLETEKYDTWTNTWQILPANASLNGGRYFSRSWTDFKTNQILLFGGRRYNCSEVMEYTPRLIDIFYLSNETFRTVEDPADNIYLAEAGFNLQALAVRDFYPNGEPAPNSSNSTQVTADIVFVFGGGSGLALPYAWTVQFISILAERELYPRGEHFLEIDSPSPNDLAASTFDAYQRYEFDFRVINTLGVLYQIDDSWAFEFLITDWNGVTRTLSETNEEYSTQVLMAETMYAVDDQCQISTNVKSEFHLGLMIPSRRTLHNGYCVDPEQYWMFKPGFNSTITFIARKDGFEEHSQEFVFSFAEINKTQGQCYLITNSSDLFDEYKVQCSGYSFDGKIEHYEIGAVLHSDTIIRYNLLMDDVLLTTTYAKQHLASTAITGIVSHDVDEASLIAIVGAETVAGGWTSNCFSDLVVVDWQPLSAVLAANFNTANDLYQAAVANLQNPTVAEILVGFSVLEEMVNSDMLPPETTVEDVQQEIEDVITSMMADDASYDTVDELVVQISVIQALTSNTELVSTDLLEDVILDFMPDILSDVEHILANETTLEEAEVIQTIGEISSNVAENMIQVLNSSMSGLTPAEQANYTSLLIETTQSLMHFALQQAWVNETLEYYHADNCSKTKGSVRPISWTKCGYGEGVTLIMPDDYLVDDGVTHFDCVITSYCEPVYEETDDGDGEDAEVDPDEIFFPDTAIDGYPHSNSSSVAGYGATSVFATTSECTPYLIVFDMRGQNTDALDTILNGQWNVTDNAFTLPRCEYYNTSENSWGEDGCVVYEVTADNVTCACTHLTTFRVSGESFDPKANTLVLDDVRVLSLENMMQFPTTWVTMLMVVVVLGVACICVPNTNADKPIIAFEDIIYKDFRDQYLHKHQQWHEIHQIDRWFTKIVQTKRELSTYSQEPSMNSMEFSENLHGQGMSLTQKRRAKQKRHPTKYWFLLSYNLFKMYLKNDHTVLSVFQRTDGTNFSTKQRIGLFLLYMYCVMLASAIFFGQKRKPIAEVLASCLISVIGTAPVYLIRILFQWAKPRVVESSPYRKRTFERRLNSVDEFSQSGQSRGGGPLVRSMSASASEETVGTGVTATQSDLLDDIMSPTDFAARSVIHKNKKRQSRTSATFLAALRHLKKATRPDMKQVRRCMAFVNAQGNDRERAELAAEVRLILFNYNYPLPHAFKKFAWAILVSMCFVCVVLSVVYGIQFDIYNEQKATASNHEALMKANENSFLSEHNLMPLDASGNGNELSSCWNMSRSLVMHAELNAQQVLAAQREYNNIVLAEEIDNPPSSGNYPLDWDSEKWLLSVLISFITSVLFWQPLNIYLLTWIKIYAFNRGLVMEASVYNLLQLFCCCCCNASRKSQSTLNQMKKYVAKESIASGMDVNYVAEDDMTRSIERELSVSSMGSGLMAGQNDRQLDLLGFLSNDDLFVDIPLSPLEYDSDGGAHGDTADIIYQD